jgi:NADPH-dependent F420 reductase
VKIAVLGTGRVGGTLGERWARAGHEVAFGSRDPVAEKCQQLLTRAGKSARITSPAEAVKGAEVVVLAAPWTTAKALLQSIGDLSGKVIVDCINPLNKTFNGLELGHTTSAAEEIASWVPAARVVKAFNTVSSAAMADPKFGDDRAMMFYCSDHADAKALVRRLSDDLGLDSLDAGPLRIARYLEPFAMLSIHLAIQEGWGGNFGVKILRR